MSVNPVSAHTQAATPEPAAKPQPAKNDATTPQDTVTLSSQAKGQPTPPSGDANHDGDSR